MLYIKTTYINDIQKGDNLFITENPIPEELPYKYCWKYQDHYIVTDSTIPNSGDIMRTMDSVDGTNGAGIDVYKVLIEVKVLFII